MSKNGEIIKGSGARLISGYNAMKVQLNLNKLRELLRDNPQYKQSYDSKDGTKNEFVELEIWENKPEYQTKFSTHYVKLAEPYKPADNKFERSVSNKPNPERFPVENTGLPF